MTFTVRRGVYHAVARCQGCGWREEDHRRAERAATRHCIETGHRVDLVVGEPIDRITVEEAIGAFNAGACDGPALPAPV